MRSLTKDTFREIKNTFSRFLSIMLISMLGVAFLAGIKTSAPSMRASVNAYYDEQALMDMRLLSSLGLTDEDVSAALALEDVAAAEGSYTADLFIAVDGSDSVAKAHSVPETLNLPLLLEGALPASAYECAIEEDLAAFLSLGIGDTIELHTEEGTYDGAVNHGAYTISGIVQSPLYISFERGSSTLGSGRAAYYIYLPREAFALEYYTEVSVRLRGGEGLIRHSEEYEAFVDSRRPALEAFLDTRSELRYDSIYTEARRELDKAWGDFYAMEEAYGEYASAEISAALRAAQSELEAQEEQLSTLADWSAYALDLSSLPAFSSFADDSERVGALANVFPIIFFIVAALVCLTTMTRMVDEQRLQIGALKALGYGKWAVARKYILYALFASLLGSILGILLGSLTIPRVIFAAYSILYTLPEMVLDLSPSLCVWSSAAAILSTTVAAFAAVFTALRTAPAELMRPRAPAPGKRVFLERIKPLWRRLSFTKKVTARNLLRYKKRLIMTVVGIGGCTGLLIAGFGLQDSIFGIVDRHFEVSLYDLIAIMSPQATKADMDTAVETLRDDELVQLCLPAYQNGATFSGNKRTISGYVVASDEPEALRQYFVFRGRKDGETVDFPADSGALVTEKLAELLNLSVGDEIILDESGRSARVAGIIENYVSHYVFLSSAYYETVYGEAYAPNIIFVRSAGGDAETNEALSEKLISLGTVHSVSNTKATVDSIVDSLNLINYAVLVIIIAAAALAFIVLYNLTNINITERIRELATIKVLGFYDREVSSYLYRENVILTGLGALLGLLFGYLLHQWLVLTVEVDLVMFVRSADLSSYVYSLLLTLAFSMLVNVAAHFRLKKIDMVLSLKSAE